MVNRQGPDRLTEKVAKYLIQSNVLPVPFGKGAGIGQLLQAAEWCLILFAV